MDDIVKDFVAEALEAIEALDGKMVTLEQDPNDPVLLGDIFRLIHTIKGTSGFLGLMRLQTVAHAAENVLAPFGTAVWRWTGLRYPPFSTWSTW